MPQKNVIITGAMGNLGKVVTKQFLQAGYKIIATASPRSTIKTETENLTYYKVDLTSEKESISFLEKAIVTHGRIHAALLLTGGFAPGKLQKASGEDLNKMLMLNFKTVFHIAQPAWAHMKDQEEGCLILIGAKPVLNANEAKNSVAYSLSKSLIFKFAEILNADAKDQNLTASVIVPGTIDTSDNRSAMPNADFSSWISPDAIADVMLRMCADAAYAKQNPIVRMF